MKGAYLLKKLKSIVVTILAMALCASLLTAAYAKNTSKNGKQPVLSADIQTLIDLGLLTGSDASGVTYEYTKSKPTRIQAFIIYLRLMNEDEKLEKYLWRDGDGNFDDQHGHSPFVKKGMAFAKAHPEYNWIGSNGRFNPMAHLTAREFAKVLLAALGYEYNKDFTWSTVEGFAEGLGLNVPEGAFTFEVLASMTVQALNMTVKGTTQKLIDRLDLDPATDTTKPTVTDVVLSAPYVAGPPAVSGTVTIYFSEDMNSDTLKNTANYAVDFDGSAVAYTSTQLSQLSSASAVPAADNKSVTLTIPGSALNGGTAAGTGITDITITNLKDIAGNNLDTTTTFVRKAASLTVTAAPAAVAADKLQVTFNNPMQTVDPSEFRLYKPDGVTPVTAGTGYTLDTTGKIVTITMGASLTADAKAAASDTAAVKLAIGTANTKDIFSNAVSGDVAVAVSAATPATVTILDKIAPAIAALETQDLDKDGYLDAVRLTFSENVKDSTVSASNFDVAGTSGEAFNPATAGDTADNHIIYITFTESATPDTDLTPTITYTQGTLEDTAGNKLASTGALTTADKAAPAVITALPVGTLTAGGTASSAALVLSEDLTAENRAVVLSAVQAHATVNDLVTTGDIAVTYVWMTNRLLTVSITENANGGTDPDTLILSAASADLLDAAGNTAAAQIIK
jgi:hypothetical protein